VSIPFSLFFWKICFSCPGRKFSPGHCRRRTWQFSPGSGCISLFLRFLSASQERRAERIFLKRDFAKFISAMAKGWRLRHAALVGRWHNPFAEPQRRTLAEVGRGASSKMQHRTNGSAGDVRVFLSPAPSRALA